MQNDLLSGWNIVVIDDEDDSLQVSNIILVSHGASVYPATNGKQGLRIVRQKNPHFVISDLSMPIMDGWSFLDTLQADPEMLHIPVIALTAHGMVGDREKALSAGFLNYLTKPLTVETFMKDLMNVILDIPVLAQKLNTTEKDG
jgi:CheY-like chemotaxis protein